MEGHGDGYPTRFSDYGLNAKDNSQRQAYRYLDQARRLKRPVPVGDAKMSFTVKLSRTLIGRLRSYAATTGLTLSEIVNRALLAVLHRGGGRG
jgi:hypothetical protein